MSTACDAVARPISPVSVAADGVRLSVRLTPRGSSDRVIGLALDANGDAVLKAAVTAPPEDGRANAALLKLLARALRLPVRDFAVLHGAASRQKIVFISGEPKSLARRIEEVFVRG